jgi:hypothetical protein
MLLTTAARGKLKNVCPACDSVQGLPVSSSSTSVIAFRAAETLRSNSSRISSRLVSFGNG